MFSALHSQLWAEGQGSVWEDLHFSSMLAGGVDTKGLVQFHSGSVPVTRLSGRATNRGEPDGFLLPRWGCGQEGSCRRVSVRIGGKAEAVEVVKTIQLTHMHTCMHTCTCTHTHSLCNILMTAEPGG